jgi:hypothetical protein
MLSYLWLVNNRVIACLGLRSANFGRGNMARTRSATS